MLFVPDDRFLAGIVIPARGHRLVPALVDARPVTRLVGVVARFAFGHVQALFRPSLFASFAPFRAVTLAVFPSVRPVHLLTPFHCAGGMPHDEPPADRWQWL